MQKRASGISADSNFTLAMPSGAAALRRASRLHIPELSVHSTSLQPSEWEASRTGKAHSNKSRGAMAALSLQQQQVHLSGCTGTATGHPAPAPLESESPFLLVPPSPPWACTSLQSGAEQGLDVRLEQQLHIFVAPADKCYLCHATLPCRDSTCLPQAGRCPGHKMKYREKKLFYGEGGQTLAQVAWRACRVSILRDTQNAAGHGSEQPAAAAPALSRGWAGRSAEMPCCLNYSLLIPYFGRAEGREVVGKTRARRKKRDHNEIHSLKRKCLCFLSRHMRQQSLLVKMGL
ncbi:hypothetical protein QYF61_020973 [Mycteria americana]|uniref:Uncharacterized protein n=1 Tax=Mycteria americana TaxID=33587 RepID=A0AAN7PVQ6_MYCAM|nr:hypothetical protein QYF61_020973 [Mycteria americana]